MKRLFLIALFTILCPFIVYGQPIGGGQACLPLSGGVVTGATTFEAAVGVGKSDGSGGANLNIYATLGTELITAPMVTGGWTMTDGWSITAGVLSRAGGTTTGTATAVSGMTSAPTAGVTYKVVIVCSAAANSPTYTLGGVTGTTITATTITDYITASTTAKIIFSGGSTATATISSVSVKALTDATGDLTVNGNLTVRSPSTFESSVTVNKGQLLFPDGSISVPGIAFGSDSDTGIYRSADGVLAFTSNSSLVFRADSTSGLRSDYPIRGTTSLSINDDVFIVREGANILAFRVGANLQTINIYNTYTDASNYERLTLTGVQGASVNVTAETAGTGADNLDIVLTPAGTGGVTIRAKEIFIDCTDAATPYPRCTASGASTLAATEVMRTIINSYGRAGAQTVTLPTAASGAAFTAIVGTQHNSAFKIQRAGTDTICFDGTCAKTYFQETNQIVGSYVSCTTFKTGAAAWTWLCSTGAGTFVTD